MFVIQEKLRGDGFKSGGWHTFNARFKTKEEAQAALDKTPMNKGMRIAEEYTVTRYKAV